MVVVVSNVIVCIEENCCVFVDVVWPKKTKNNSNFIVNWKLEKKAKLAKMALSAGEAQIRYSPRVIFNNTAP